MPIQQNRVSNKGQQQPPTFLCPAISSSTTSGMETKRGAVAVCSTTEMFQDWQPEYREDDGTGTHWDNMNMNQGMGNDNNIHNRIRQQEATTGRIMQREQALLQFKI
jgi:hypothetical protein